MTGPEPPPPADPVPPAVPAPADPVPSDPVPPLSADSAWSRLHPLTPLLRGGRFLLLVLAVVVNQGLRDPRVLAVVLLVGTPAAVLLGYVSWRSTRYRLTATELQVDSGVLQRRNRRVPLARLQSVDVVRPLVARALGLAQLRLEVAAGGDTEAPLSYLADGDAERLRRRLLALAAGAPDGEDAPEPLEAVLVRVPTQVLVVAALLGAPAIITGLLLVALLVVVVVEPSATPGVLVSGAPLLLGSGGLVVRRLLADQGFTVAESSDGLRLRHGLLETRSQTIPAGRVQAIQVREPLLWRRRGWVRVDVDVAGYAAGAGEQQATTSVLLPVAPREFALALVARVLGAALPPADRPAPRAARWRAPLSARRLRVGLDAAHLVATSGVLTTTTDVVPLARVQSLRLVQGPWQRRLGLASVHADGAGRRLPGAVARHRDAAEAAALLADLTGRTRLARRR